MTASSRRALLSVSDKRDLVPFARRLAALGYELVSTGGTFRVLREADVPVTYVSDVTEHPEVFDGRVKTLHPRIHGGILFNRAVEQHHAEAADNRIVPIDVVVVNLYPFRETIARDGVSADDAVENIDIGGPAMVRAAAKNFSAVTIVVSPDAYDRVADELEAHGETSFETRRQLALDAFRHTAAYDAAIATWLATECGEDAVVPDEIHAPLIKVDDLRYGENPHQRAAIYRPDGAPAYSGANVLQGKALSYNNLVDLDGAVGAVLEFDEPACVVVKHTNPCGVGRDEGSLLTAWERALAGDPVSAFGGIVALNREVDVDVAEGLTGLFLEIVAAPSFSAAAVDVLASKKNLRVVTLDAGRLAPRRAVRPTLFGTLVQDADPVISRIDEAWDVATERAPTADEAVALRFMWRVCKHVKSNAIVLGNAERTLGVGAGQMSRVDAVHLAVRKATGLLDGAVLASDAFFPFRDGVDAAAAAGIRAIVQPGGSRRDPEVIDACNEHGIAMVFTGHRHFRH